jgi:hypothetical protein
MKQFQLLSVRYCVSNSFSLVHITYIAFQLFQVRPIFANLNKSAKWFKDEGRYSVDEVMIPYFGRHSSKQFICGKNIRYGFKVKTRYMVHIPYMYKMR